jgi:hypothetical protein
LTITALAVAELLRAHRYQFAHEDGLQAGVAEALTAAGLSVRREVRLSRRDRLDVMVHGVGVEVKVAGGADRVLGQLQRYAGHDRVAELVLVTTLARHRVLPDLIGGKPLAIVHLGGAA